MRRQECHQVLGVLANVGHFARLASEPATGCMKVAACGLQASLAKLRDGLFGGYPWWLSAFACSAVLQEHRGHTCAQRCAYVQVLSVLLHGHVLAWQRRARAGLVYVCACDCPCAKNCVELVAWC